MSPTARRKLGDFGEAHARRQLEAMGYSFVAANWRCAAGELDLVMRDGQEVVFVEVKTRRGEQAGRAEESVSEAKGQRLLTTAQWFFGDHPELSSLIWRIDLFAITLDRTGTVRRTSHVVNAVTTN